MEAPNLPKPDSLAVRTLNSTSTELRPSSTAPSSTAPSSTGTAQKQVSPTFGDTDPDRFVVLLSTFEVTFAQQMCVVLEDAEVPVLLEHVEIAEGSLKASAYRILIPFNESLRAGAVREAFERRKLNLRPPRRPTAAD